MIGWSVAVFVAAMVGSAVPAAGGDEGLELTLLCFNIRHGTARDGEDAWEHRREMVFDVLREPVEGGGTVADVIGLQEALRFQLDEIAAAVPGYAQVGVGRSDGRVRGEHASILYRSDRFVVDESGTFWLSDTPGEPGSATWGNRIPRVCTWARLVDKSTGRGVYVYNTHLDHQSQPSRERAVELIAGRISGRTHADPAVLMGDFNAGESNPAVLYLTGKRERASEGDGDVPAPPGLVDSFRVLHPEAEGVGTFHAFRGGVDREKIDSIFVEPSARVLEAWIDRRQSGERYPSDHFPVGARVVVRE